MYGMDGPEQPLQLVSTTGNAQAFSPGITPLSDMPPQDVSPGPQQPTVSSGDPLDDPPPPAPPMPAPGAAPAVTPHEPVLVAVQPPPASTPMNPLVGLGAALLILWLTTKWLNRRS